MELSIERREGQTIYTIARNGETAGWVVIDSPGSGRAHGGLRLHSGVTEEEVGALARTMSLKYGLLGLPFGGAKAGLRGDPEAPLEERRALLAGFAQAIAPLLLSRVYVPAADMGTDTADIRALLEMAGAPIRRRQLRVERSGVYTAATVLVTAREAARHTGLELSGCTAAIEGFGKVGGALAEKLSQAGVRIVAVSTSRGALYDPEGLDIERLSSLALETGSRVVEHYPGGERMVAADLLGLHVDLLFPCAGYASVDRETAATVRAKIVCPGANNPLTAEAERIVTEAGTLSFPDFASNAGGVLGTVLEYAGVDVQQILRLIENDYAGQIAWILETGGRTGRTPREVAASLSAARSRIYRQPDSGVSLSSRIVDIGMELHRRGLVPAGIVGAAALRQFRSRLAIPPEAASGGDGAGQRSAGPAGEMQADR